MEQTMIIETAILCVPKMLAGNNTTPPSSTHRDVKLDHGAIPLPKVSGSVPLSNCIPAKYALLRFIIPMQNLMLRF